MALFVSKVQSEGKVQSPKHLQKKTIVKNVFLVSKTTLQLFIYNTNTVWIEEKYEVFRHLIKDNKYKNNKINKQYGQVRFQFASFMSFFI
jgi:hypothetical protein